MFEPTRLAAEHLTDAYQQLVPLRRRSLQAPPAATQESTDAKRSIPTRRQR